MITANSLDNMLDIVKSLVLSGYIVHVKAIYKAWPRETNIDCFEIIYLNNQENITELDTEEKEKKVSWAEFKEAGKKLAEATKKSFEYKE